MSCTLKTLVCTLLVSHRLPLLCCCFLDFKQKNIHTYCLICLMENFLVVVRSYVTPPSILSLRFWSALSMLGWTTVLSLYTRTRVSDTNGECRVLTSVKDYQKIRPKVSSYLSFFLLHTVGLPPLSQDPNFLMFPCVLSVYDSHSENSCTLIRH